MEIARVFGHVLKFCYDHLTGENYVLAILLFAFAMQLLLCPFSIFQQKNMIKQAKMRPKEYMIRKKYAGRNDRATMQKMNNEIMALQQSEGYNPLMGCLPMLFQLILIFPIYNTVVKPLRYITGLPMADCDTIFTCFSRADMGMPKSAGQIWLSQKLPTMSYEQVSQIIKEIPGKDNKWIVSPEEAQSALGALYRGGTELRTDIDFANIPNGMAEAPISAFTISFAIFGILLLIPFINLGLTYLQQFVSKKLSYQDPYANQQAGGMMGSMKIMMLVMPLMTFFFTFTFPAAIGIYWIFRTVLAIIQQVILSLIFKIPKYTDEDLKRIEKEMKEAKNNATPKRRSLFQMPTNDVLEERGIRSLHHIDDDDE